MYSMQTNSPVRTFFGSSNDIFAQPRVLLDHTSKYVYCVRLAASLIMFLRYQCITEYINLSLTFSPLPRKNTPSLHRTTRCTSTMWHHKSLSTKWMLPAAILASLWVSPIIYTYIHIYIFPHTHKYSVFLKLWTFALKAEWSSFWFWWWWWWWWFWSVCVCVSDVLQRDMHQHPTEGLIATASYDQTVKLWTHSSAFT